MIARHVGGERVGRGIYWSNNWEFVSISEEGGRLEGGPGNRYVRAPLPVVLVVGPLLGLGFAIFLPLSGILLLMPLLAGRALSALFARRMEVVPIAGIGAQPGASYLEAPTSSVSRSDEHESERPGQLMDLAREIARKRWESK